jgi:hypothetical protein
MENHGCHNDGWYSHDGEGKGMCTGPGCDCDEKKYGSHSSSSNGSVSTLGAILCTVGSLIGTCMILALLGVEDAPAIVIIVLWAVILTVLVSFGSKHGL